MYSPPPTKSCRGTFNLLWWRHKLRWSFLKGGLFLWLIRTELMLWTVYSIKCWQYQYKTDAEYWICVTQHRAKLSSQTGSALNRNANTRLNESACTKNMGKGFHNLGNCPHMPLGLLTAMLLSWMFCWRARLQREKTLLR